MRLAVLDANVLYGAFGRDVLLRLAAAGLYRPRWTAQIEGEWVRTLLATRPDLAPERLGRTRAAMARAFPDAAVSGYEGHEDDLRLPDPDDRHVLAAAVEAGAGEVVTWNLGDFPAAVLAPLGIEAVSPDDFVGSMLAADPDRVVAVMRAHRAGLHRPPLTAEDYLSHLERSGLVDVVASLGVGKATSDRRRPRAARTTRPGPCGAGGSSPPRGSGWPPPPSGTQRPTDRAAGRGGRRTGRRRR